MYISPELKTKVLERLSTTKNYGKISRELATSIRVVEHLDVTENKRFNYTPEGKGPAALQPFVVASMDLRHTTEWDNTQPALAKARLEYDKGLVELVTGRDGFNLFVYAIPRKVRIVRKPYFSRIEEEV